MEYPRVGYRCIIGSKPLVIRGELGSEWWLNHILISGMRYKEILTRRSLRRRNKKNGQKCMIRELYEITTEKNGVMKWAFFVVHKGMKPWPSQKPFAEGSWTLGVNDAEGQALREAGRTETAWEVARLNRNGRVPPRR